MNVTKGNYSATGPRCMLKQMDGLRAGRCYDGQSDTLQPGGPTQVYPCIHQWYQFVSFGDGEHAPLGSLYSTIPSHIVKQIRNLGHEQSPHMCFGVYGRSGNDEPDWDEEVEQQLSKETKTEIANVQTNDDEIEEELPPLSDFKGEDIVTTQCRNTGAIIEWVFVPFIVEDAIDENTMSADPTTKPDAEMPEIDEL